MSSTTSEQFGKVYPDGRIEWAPVGAEGYWATPEHRAAENDAYRAQLAALGVADPPSLAFVSRTISVTTGEPEPVVEPEPSSGPGADSAPVVD